MGRAHRQGGAFLGSLTLTEVVEDSEHSDISFLARELNVSTEAIMRLAVSARLAASFQLPAASFYAFLRQQVPAALPRPLLEASDGFTLIDALVASIASMIFGLDAATQRQTILRAVAAGFVSTSLAEDVDTLLSELQTHHQSDMLTHPYLVGSATLGQLLDVVALPQEQQQAFAQALATNTQTIRAFWRTLGDGSHGLTTQQASAVERTLTIGSFVKNYVPLVQELVGQFNAGTYTQLHDLARISLQDWETTIGRTGAPPGVQPAGNGTPEQVFAAVVYARITRVYPTAALSSRVATSGVVPAEDVQPVQQFFTNNPDLELVKHYLAGYLQQKGDAAFTGVAEDAQPAVLDIVRRMQRVLKVAPEVDVAEALLQNGISSATDIAMLGEVQFLSKAKAAGLTGKEATAVLSNAVQRYATVIALYSQLNVDAVGLWPQAVGNLSQYNGLTQQAIQRDDSLATLFGSQSYCATDDCTSILSPAAYVCDLLLWLRGHVTAGQTALDVLDARRPDIRHLLLDCPNTDTELPYIDLVIELLADAVSSPSDTVSTSYLQRGLTDGATYYWIVTAVNALGEGPPSAQASGTPAAPVAAPPAPTGLALAVGNGQLTVIFDAVAGATSYNLYYRDVPGVTTANGTQVLDITSPHVLGGLTDGTSYGVIVTAVNALGEGPASAEVDAIPAAPVAVPAAPTGLAAAVGDGELTITWDPVAGATSYNLYYATSSGVTPATGTELPGARSPYLQSGLVDATTYYYVVTAVNGLGEGAPSPQVSATPEVPTLVPPAPTGLTVLAGDGEATLSWDPVAGATSYNLYFSTSSGVTPATGTEIPGSWNPRWKQTSASATPAQLAAAPAYFNQGAFVVLANAAYPPSLPYSAGLDELRTVLTHWSLPLWQLRQSLLPLSGATLAQHVAVAGERFAMSPHGVALASTSGLVPLTVAWNDANPGTDLAAVDAFLQASGLTYEQLIELLEVQFVQGGLGVAIEGSNDLCDTGQEHLAPTPLDQGFLDRAIRFLRVWLATGWKMWELDLLLASPAVGAGALDQDALVGLFAFRSVQDATGLAVDQLLAWYGDMDTATHRDPDGSTTTSLYARTFLDPSVSVLAPDRDLAVLPTGGTIADPLLADHLLAVQAGLGVSATDTATLAGLTNGQLTLDNLSLMYRVASLAAAAHLAISDLLTVAGLLQPGAASATAALAPLLGSPGASLAFLQQVMAIKQCGLSLDALTYLLTPPSPAVPGGWTTTTQMSTSDLTSALDAVLAAVSAVPAGTTLAAPITAVQTTITVLADSGFPPAPFAIAIGSEVMSVTAVGGTGNTTWTVLRAQQSTAAAAAAAGATVSLAGGPLAGNIVAAVAAKAHPAGVAGIADDVTSLVLSTFLLPGTASTLIEVLSDPAFTSSTTPVSQTAFPNQWLAMQLFDKVAVLVRSLRLVEPEVAFLLDNTAHFGGLDLTALPVLLAQSALSLGSLLTTTLLLTLARTWTAPSPSSPVQTLYDVIGGVIAGTIPDVVSAQAALAAVTGWSAADIATFATRLQLTYPGDYEHPASYDALRTLQAMAAKAGTSGATLAGWATVPADEATAQGLGGSALSALKAQQTSSDAWLALAPSLTDPMRERRAAALVAYLSALRDFTGAYLYGDADGLFDHFLIDVEMSSCMLTSRVVQAYLAVQIFVERCLMGQEAPAVVADPSTDSTWSYWSWMDRYRVWEANREVFCYPENWLIESQRANRTENYVTFEQEVRQGTLTADYLETVVLNYIDRLDQVAHLRVTGTCEDPATGDLYVVARTVADPPTYYTRTLSGGSGRAGARSRWISRPTKWSLRSTGGACACSGPT